MAHIISNSQLQKNIWKITKNIWNTTYTVINRGFPKMVILPYFDDNEDFIADYLEEYQLRMNAKKLKKELEDSFDSWISSFKI